MAVKNTCKSIIEKYVWNPGGSWAYAEFVSGMYLGDKERALGRLALFQPSPSACPS